MRLSLACRLLAFLALTFLSYPLQAAASGVEARRAYLAGKHLLALQLAQPAAESGDNTAMLTLGMLYFRGEGVRQDYAAALKWWRASAALGDRRVQQRVGLLFRYGWGVERNYAEALKWFELSAENGEALAYWSLGLMHETGDGLTKDIKKSIEFYRKSIEAFKLELVTEPENRKEIESSITQLTWRTRWLTSLSEKADSSTPESNTPQSAVKQ